VIRSDGRLGAVVAEHALTQAFQSFQTLAAQTFHHASGWGLVAMLQEHGGELNLRPAHAEKTLFLPVFLEITGDPDGLGRLPSHCTGETKGRETRPRAARRSCRCRVPGSETPANRHGCVVVEFLAAALYQGMIVPRSCANIGRSYLPGKPTSRA